MIKLISFSSVQKQLSMPSAILKSHCHNTAQLDWLILPATRRRKERKSRGRADLANAGEFNRRYLVDQISAILNANRGDRRKSQSPYWAHLAIFANSRDRRIKPLGVSTALGLTTGPTTWVTGTIKSGMNRLVEDTVRIGNSASRQSLEQQQIRIKLKWYHSVKKKS